MDPEINLRNYSSGNDRQIGVDGGSYPAAKQYLVGVNLSSRQLCFMFYSFTVNFKKMKK